MDGAGLFFYSTANIHRVKFKYHEGVRVTAVSFTLPSLYVPVSTFPDGLKDCPGLGCRQWEKLLELAPKYEGKGSHLFY